MSVQERLENVNESNIFICFCLFWWILLIGAQADHIISLPYWALFFPLWVWKFTVFSGWLIGLIVWLRHRARLAASPELSYIPFEDPALPHIQAMSITTFFTLLLSCSEILLCLHLSLPSLKLAYVTILTPLLLVGLLGLFGFFFLMIDSRSLFAWARRRRGRNLLNRTRSVFGHNNSDENDPILLVSHARVTRSFTMEFFIAANLLQILFLISRLDNWIRSKWTVTFIPTFILLALGFLFCTVLFVVALIRYFTAFFIPLTQRRLPIYYYASLIIINLLLCSSMVFLALRLDDALSPTQISYTLISTPVLLCLIIYAFNSFYLGSGNPWWFGLNKNFLLALFESCPALQLCVNTSVNPSGLWKPAEHGGRVMADGSHDSSDPLPVSEGNTESTSGFHSHICASPTGSTGPNSQQSLPDALPTPLSPSLYRSASAAEFVSLCVASVNKPNRESRVEPLLSAIVQSPRCDDSPEKVRYPD